MYKKIKTLIFPLANLAFRSYNLKTRKFTHKGITVKINSEVFPPKFTISTKLLLKYMGPLNLKNKTCLELGCGSGIIALFAASKGAKVIATDINLVATDTLRIAALENNLEITVIESDLFEHVPSQVLDYIFINPPYYPKNPKNTKEYAWFCGENFEYFERLFSQLNTVSFHTTLMILSEDCDISFIKDIALKNSLQFQLLANHKVMKEESFIFKITKI